MEHSTPRTILLVVLAIVFTAGLTFASLELPYLVDEYLIETVHTPDIESRTGEGSEYATELFIRHYHLRTIGYACFFATVILVGWGFATRRSSLATLGALGLILPMFAQFAGVMFFLAGLGMLNLLWLPVLDIAWDIPQLGSIIRAPYDILRWVFRLVDVNVYWPLVYACIGGGLFIFLTSTFTWLHTRAGHDPIATSWLYKYSRHPQYLGWILWTYGLYLLILQARYPKRSWGIDPSLSWLLATMVIVGVAMVEELKMRERSGEAYEAYIRRTPFLFPVPRFLSRLASAPFRMLSGKDRAERPLHVAAYLAVLSAGLMAGSWFFYGPGWPATARMFTSGERFSTSMSELASRIRTTDHPRTRYFLALELSGEGPESFPYLERLLHDSIPGVRAAGLDGLRSLGLADAVPAIVPLLDDPVSSVRGSAAVAVAELGGPHSIGPLLRLLTDPDRRIRAMALSGLSRMGATQAVPIATEGLDDEHQWYRIACINYLAAVGARDAEEDVRRLLDDRDVSIRRAAVVALARIGSEASRSGLERAASDSDLEVRIYAEEALRALSRARPE